MALAFYRLVEKKRQTVKNTLSSDVEERLVRYRSETYPGRVHDKHICDAEELGFPADIDLCQDTGFQGYLQRVSTYINRKKTQRERADTRRKRGAHTHIKYSYSD
jgi:hypothetical protein